MKRVVCFLIGFIIWVVLTWPFADGRVDVQVITAGVIAAFLASVLFHRTFADGYRIFISPVRAFWFLVYLPVFFYYVIKANLDVVYRALHPKMPIKPGIIKVKTSLKTDSGITALANSITLTPGTLTVDVTQDGYLYVHWINVKSTEVEQASEYIVRRFEWFLKKIFE